MPACHAAPESKAASRSAYTGRRALHPAQVLQLARAAAGAGTGEYPERAAPRRPAPSLGRRVRRAAAVAAIGTLAGGLVAAARR